VSQNAPTSEPCFTVSLIFRSFFSLLFCKTR